MQLTLEKDYGIELTPEGVIFPELTPKEEVIRVWKHMKFHERFSAKGAKSCREYFEKKYGFHEALMVEAVIITELGFEVKVRITDGDEATDPIPVTGRFVKMFTALQSRWRLAIKTGNVEYLKLAADALKPMVDEWHQIKSFLEEARK
jgi:hypothetical protein